jgi:hypothetical protein
LGLIVLSSIFHSAVDSELNSSALNTFRHSWEMERFSISRLFTTSRDFCLVVLELRRRGHLSQAAHLLALFVHYVPDPLDSRRSYFTSVL